jgi:hypothetical protein
MQLQWRVDPSELSTVYGWTFESKDARGEFIEKHPADIFWCYFPEEDDGWVKGPAWKIAAAEAAVARQDQPSDLDDDERWLTTR